MLHMDNNHRIAARFGFTPPKDYDRFWVAGLLSNNQTTGLKLSRFRWLSPGEIADCPWPSYKIKSLVPFARTHGRDHFCWFTETATESWIADCPRDSDFGEGVASHFEAFVFRSLLEEFADSWLPQNSSDAAEMFRAYAQRVRSVMRPQWEAMIAGYASREPIINRWGRPSVISKEEFDSLVSAELAFPFLRHRFRQNTD
jgi:hypothetical protein